MARWNAPAGEKKSCFNEYLQLRKNQEREDARKRAKAAREDFVAMVVESHELSSRDTFRRAREVLEEDARWGAAVEREREELFREAIKEKAKVRLGLIQLLCVPGVGTCAGRGRGREVGGETGRKKGWEE